MLSFSLFLLVCFDLPDFLLYTDILVQYAQLNCTSSKLPYYYSYPQNCYFLVEQTYLYFKISYFFCCYSFSYCLYHCCSSICSSNCSYRFHFYCLQSESQGSDNCFLRPCFYFFQVKDNLERSALFFGICSIESCLSS